MKIWEWLWLVWTAAVMRVQAIIHISGETRFCAHYPNQTLICDLTDQSDRDAVMTEGNNQTQWNDWMVIGASSLVLTEQCFAEIKKVTVESSQSITTISSTARRTSDCLYILVLEDSQANYISHVTKNIKLISSTATKINLNSVEQFDMVDSTVHDMNIKATSDKSTIVNSVINDITRMVLEGDFQFQAEDSNIFNVHNLTYNTSNDRSVIRSVIIDRVYTNGLVIANGPLLIEEATFKTLDSRSFIIELDDSLTIRNSVFINVEIDSLILSSGSLQFDNVTIGSHTGVSIILSGAAGGVKPLAFVLDCPSSKPWIAGVVVSLVAGIVVGGAVVYFVQPKMKLITQDKDRIELLSPDAPPSTKSSDLTSKPHSPSPVPERSPPPIPVEDDDQWYDDVNVRDSVQQEHGAPPLPASRPPLQANLSPKEINKEESDEEPVYEDVCSPDTAQPQNFFPRNAPHLPAHPPGFAHTPYNGPPPPLGPPPPTKESFEANKNKSLIKEVPEKLKTSKPRPPPPPSRTDSALSSAKFSSSSSDDRDHLPPPPPPTDDAEAYDDVADIHSDTRKVAKPPPVTNKPSFLHTTPKPTNKPDWVRGIPGAAKPPGTGAAGDGATQQQKWPPPAKPPAPPSHTNPPSAKNTYSDEEDIYEEVE